jgi:threonine/homoserine/homoserine lactone efflux protein
MADLWVTLISLVIATAVAPGRVIALILLFHTKRGALTGLAFVSGILTTMLLHGLIFGLIFSLAGYFGGGEGDVLPTIVSLLLLVIGILLLVAAAKFLFQAEDEDRAPPKWLDQIESFTPRKAFNLGFGWLNVSPKQWVFDLAAVAVIFAAGLSAAASLFNYLIYILLAQTLYLLLIFIDVAMPKRSTEILDGLFVWLKRNAQTVIIVVFIGFGLFFFVKGLVGLVA